MIFVVGKYKYNALKCAEFGVCIDFGEYFAKFTAYVYGENSFKVSTFIKDGDGEADRSVQHMVTASQQLSSLFLINRRNAEEMSCQ